MIDLREIRRLVWAGVKNLKFVLKKGIWIFVIGLIVGLLVSACSPRSVNLQDNVAIPTGPTRVNSPAPGLDQTKKPERMANGNFVPNNAAFADSGIGAIKGTEELSEGYNQLIIAINYQAQTQLNISLEDLNVIGFKLIGEKRSVPYILVSNRSDGKIYSAFSMDANGFYSFLPLDGKGKVVFLPIAKLEKDNEVDFGFEVDGKLLLPPTFMIKNGGLIYIDPRTEEQANTLENEVLVLFMNPHASLNNIKVKAILPVAPISPASTPGKLADGSWTPSAGAFKDSGIGKLKGNEEFSDGYKPLLKKIKEKALSQLNITSENLNITGIKLIGEVKNVPFILITTRNDGKIFTVFNIDEDGFYRYIPLDGEGKLVFLPLMKVDNGDEIDFGFEVNGAPLLPPVFMIKNNGLKFTDPRTGEQAYINEQKMLALLTNPQEPLQKVMSPGEIEKEIAFPSSSQMFHRDFSQPDASLEGLSKTGWSIQKIEGKNVLEAHSTGSPAGFPEFDIGDESWSNYLLSFRFKFTECDPQGNLGCTIMVTFRSEGGQAYVLLIYPSIGSRKGVVVLDFGGPDGWKAIENGTRFTELDFKRKTWYEVRLAVNRDTISVVVDDNWAVSVVDDRLDAGGIGIAVGPKSKVQFDEFNVWKLP